MTTVTTTVTNEESTLDLLKMIRTSDLMPYKKLRESLMPLAPADRERLEDALVTFMASDAAWDHAVLLANCPWE